MLAAEAIVFDWAVASYPADSAAIAKVLTDSFSADRQDSRNRNDGDVEAVLNGAVLNGAVLNGAVLNGDVLEAAYSVP